MSTSSMLRVWLVVAIGSLTLRAQEPAVRVPASLLDWARADQMTMTMLLVEAGLAAGLEMREEDYVAFQKLRPLQWNPDALNLSHFQEQPTVDAGELIARFNDARRDYRAEVQEGVIVIRPTANRVAYLDSYALVGRLAGVGLMRTAEKVFKPLDPRLDRDGGRVGSYLGRVGVEIDYGDTLTLAVDATPLTVRETLNAIVRQAAPRAWIVITTNDAAPAVKQFGFMHRWGAATYITIQP